jgi:hypothetical protein
VGYALAQVKPLLQIKTSDTSLRAAIDQLSSAYQNFYTDNGSKVAGKLVTSADKKINKICPGATS